MPHFEGGERIETTHEHPFYVEGKGFVPVGELGIGTSIVTRAGPAIELVKVERKDAPATVYNFEVEEFHTYFVGDLALWVHNDCTHLYRPVPEEELAYIYQWGDYGLAPSGGGKYFSYRQEDAENFAWEPFN